MGSLRTPIGRSKSSRVNCGGDALANVADGGGQQQCQLVQARERWGCAVPLAEAQVAVFYLFSGAILYRARRRRQRRSRSCGKRVLAAEAILASCEQLGEGRRGAIERTGRDSNVADGGRSSFSRLVVRLSRPVRFLSRQLPGARAGSASALSACCFRPALTEQSPTVSYVGQRTLPSLSLSFDLLAVAVRISPHSFITSSPFALCPPFLFRALPRMRV